MQTGSGRSILSYMEDAGFKAVMSEKGRKLTESEDAAVRAAYRVKNQKYFKHQLRLISVTRQRGVKRCVP